MRDRRTVLVVDDDQGTRDTFARALALEGLAASTAATGTEALAIAKVLQPDLLVVDWRLPDIDGNEVIRRLRAAGIRTPCLLMSACLTDEAADEARHLGASGVLDCPNIIEFVDGVRATLTPPPALPIGTASRRVPWPSGALAVHQPRSTADRWALWTLKACESDSDFPTVTMLAVVVGVSHTTYCDCCRMLTMGPHNACNLTRMLRALVQSNVDRCGLDARLFSGDPRTRAQLITRAGLTNELGKEISVGEFLRRQQFIPQTNDGLIALKKLHEKVMAS